MKHGDFFSESQALIELVTAHNEIIMGLWNIYSVILIGLAGFILQIPPLGKGNICVSSV